jgi:hypothetical protein
MSRISERLARAEARLKEIEERDNIRIIIAAGADGKPQVIDFRDPSTHPWKQPKETKPSTRATETTKRSKLSSPARKQTRRKGRP